jgi:hypothetical protein
MPGPRRPVRCRTDAEGADAEHRGTKADSKAGRSNAGLSAAQESGAMPMPGQNNDHSAPLPAPKGASSP